MQNLPKEATIRLRHVALLALVVALIAMIASVRISLEDYTPAQWVQLAGYIAMGSCLVILVYTYIGS